MLCLSLHVLTHFLVWFHDSLHLMLKFQAPVHELVFLRSLVISRGLCTTASGSLSSGSLHPVISPRSSSVNSAVQESRTLWISTSEPGNLFGNEWDNMMMSLTLSCWLWNPWKSTASGLSLDFFIFGMQVSCAV